MTGGGAVVSYPLRLRRAASSGRNQTDPDGSREPDGSFDQRLRQARSRHGLDPEPADTGADGNAIALITRVGVELVAALLVGLAIGWGLDFWLKTRPLFLLVFVLLGGVAGIVNVWRLVGRPPG